MCQVGPGDEIHDDEIRASGSAPEAVDADDVRVAEHGDRSRLADESFDQPRLVQKGLAKEFDRDQPSLAVLPRPLNLPHLPRADHALEQKIAVREQGTVKTEIGLGAR